MALLKEGSRRNTWPGKVRELRFCDDEAMCNGGLGRVGVRADSVGT